MSTAAEAGQPAEAGVEQLQADLETTGLYFSLGPVNPQDALNAKGIIASRNKYWQ